MITKGLTHEEIGQLAAAGFAPGVVEAVAREARTQRWLFLRRMDSVVLILWIIAMLGLHALYATWIETFGFEIALAVIIGFFWALGLLSWRNEIETMKHDQGRWAARRLAVLAVEARSAARVFNTLPFNALSRHGGAISGFSDLPAALRLVAQRLKQEDEKASRAGSDADPDYEQDGDGSAARYPVGLIVLAGCTVFLLFVLGARTF